jgi:hypothetical protein
LTRDATIEGLACLVLFIAVAIDRTHAAETEDAQKINTAVEALTRLENVNLEEKPAIKTAVLRVLEKTRGTPNFVKLVRHFKLTDQKPGLLEVAIKNQPMKLAWKQCGSCSNKDFALIKNSLENTTRTRQRKRRGARQRERETSRAAASNRS